MEVGFMARHARPLLIVISGPSGAGKSTLCQRLLREREDVVYSISCTTRKPRGREVDGREYFFLSEDAFQKKLDQGLFLESAVVHGARYGTLKSTVMETLQAGRSVLMDIDVQGAAQIREKARNAPANDLLKSAIVDIFIAPPSLEMLRVRLAGRKEDSPEAMARRLKNAEEEWRQAPLYRHQVVNDDLESAYARLLAILSAEQAGA